MPLAAQVLGSTARNLAAGALTRAQAVRMAMISIDRRKIGRSDNCDGKVRDSESHLQLDQLVATLQALGETAEEAECSPTLQTDELPLRLGRFEIIKELGRGGFGVVLEAFDPLLQREVALKLPLPERLIAGNQPSDFIHEARTTAKLDHPGIVRVYEVDQLGPVWYIASAMCNGSTLASWLEENPAPSPRIATLLLMQAADAVHYAHSRGVLHLDLKPENLLLEPVDNPQDTPRVVVADFGLSSDCDGTTAERRTLGGTINYMAPEQLAGDASLIGVATDIHALGVILHELLSGRQYVAPDVTTVHTTDDPTHGPPLLRSLPPTISADLAAICRKCLEEDPARRYPSARELAADLRHYLGGECVTARPVQWPIRLARWYRRRPSIAALLTLLAATALMSMGAITHLWRDAKSNLADLHMEHHARVAASVQVQSTLLRLTALTQEVSLQPRGGSRMSDETTSLIREFYPQLREWSRREFETNATTLIAAEHSLALLDGATKLTQPQLEAKFFEGVAAWRQMIEANPDSHASRQALALHLLTYTNRARHGEWLWWWDTVASVNGAEIRELTREPYADLLFYLGGRHLAEASYFEASSLLRSALQLYQQGPPDSELSPAQLAKRLIAYSHLARAEQRLGRADQYQAALEIADSLANRLEQDEVIDASTAMAIAEISRMRAREHRRQRDYLAAARTYQAAATFMRRALADAPRDAALRLALVDNLRRTSGMFLTLTQSEQAESALREAIQILDEGLEHSAGYRNLLRERATLLATLARNINRKDDSAEVQKLLEKAARDFEEVSLDNRDQRKCWLLYIQSLQSLGKIYAERGQKKKSIESHRRALALLEGLKPRTKEQLRFVEESAQAIEDLQVELLRSCLFHWKRTLGHSPSVAVLKAWGALPSNVASPFAASRAGICLATVRQTDLHRRKISAAVRPGPIDLWK